MDVRFVAAIAIALAGTGACTDGPLLGDPGDSVAVGTLVYCHRFGFDELSGPRFHIQILDGANDCH